MRPANRCVQHDLEKRLDFLIFEKKKPKTGTMAVSSWRTANEMMSDGRGVRVRWESAARTCLYGASLEGGAEGEVMIAEDALEATLATSGGPIGPLTTAGW